MNSVFLVISLLFHVVSASKYLKYNISSVCPQIRGGFSNKKTDQIEWNLTSDLDTKTLNVDRSVAALIEDSFNISVLSSQNVPLDCVFEVKTDPDTGLFLIIDRLTFLRKDEDGACRDYIKVDESLRICGIVGYDDHSIISFDLPSGTSRLHLHIDEPTAEEFETEFKISIVFTSYWEDCKQNGGFSCGNNNQRCIPDEYKRDNIINCALPKCLDELNCFNLNFEDLTVNIRNIVTIGLVSFFITGTLVGVILWCCWKKNFKRNSSSNDNNVEPNFELQAQNSGQVQEQPSPQSQSEPNSSTSDLPPSYDILFPDK